MQEGQWINTIKSSGIKKNRKSKWIDIVALNEDF